MDTLSINVALFVYVISACGLLIYGMNCYVMIFLFLRHHNAAIERLKSVEKQFKHLATSPVAPGVTTQIAIFNELNVAERIIRAACAMDYPQGLHEIQVLDDSTDETQGLVDRVVAELKAKGHDISVLRRARRVGFKAGALANGFFRSKGDLLAVFDADFIPPSDFLLRTVPFFIADSKLGLVQARWGHLNYDHSLLTRAQSIGIDGHFMVEQSARNFSGLFMNFNGTAGIWRKEAISVSGGWQWDTLTEDMDLSYRVQLSGWHTQYLPDLVVPAEIPENVNAFKSQQFRWAKGSIQTAIKLLPRIFKSSASSFQKVEAFFHMTHYLVHPLMLLLALLALPVLQLAKVNLSGVIFGIVALGLIFSMMAPNLLYMISQKAAYPDWKQRLLRLPMLTIVGVGIALSNTRAVLEAMLLIKSDFVRTPKKGDKVLKHYAVKLSWLAAIEIILGLYCTISFFFYLYVGKYIIGPFLGIYAAGFLFIGLLTLYQDLKLNQKVGSSG
jgi:cellulose synthase/poly-beta-1,6-N-acetylglucosamine synthase-like glycosyltransferase